MASAAKAPSYWHRPSTVVGMLQNIRNGAQGDIDEIVAEMESKDAELSVLGCMAEAGLVGQVCGHNSASEGSSRLIVYSSVLGKGGHARKVED